MNEFEDQLFAKRYFASHRHELIDPKGWDAWLKHHEEVGLKIDIVFGTIIATLIMTMIILEWKGWW